MLRLDARRAALASREVIQRDDRRQARLEPRASVEEALPERRRHGPAAPTAMFGQPTQRRLGDEAQAEWSPGMHCHALYAPVFLHQLFFCARSTNGRLSAITPSYLAGMSSQPLATRRPGAQNAVAPLATRRPNAKGLVVVLAKTRPPAVADIRVKQHDLVENGPTTPISSPAPSSTPSPTSVTASPQPHGFAENMASAESNASVSERELCSRLVTALRAKAAAGHILTRAELQFLGISDPPSIVAPAGRAARSSCQAEPLPGPLPAGALSVQPDAPHPAPVAVLRQHTYYDVTYCMREISALHVR